ncbi:DUF58 domain-containing protein [Tessaracoccus sp. OH4464_COT-324]|uniref:DUF58 domain-containing protein n=1 Tax=Tessaracoccus sp. OH4464_COT-324 TaxID=2491059 RepID=UPI00131A4946|nr:DUF58 domain-containing protein [Tessaracoccus sp. OH4464_COT-324]
MKVKQMGGLSRIVTALELVIILMRQNRILGSVTTVGWAVIIGGSSAALLGWNRGWLEFQSLAIMAGAALISALPFILLSPEHKADLALDSPRIKAGETAEGTIRLQAAKNKSAGATTIEFPVAGIVASFRVPSLVGESLHEELFRIPTSRRGIIQVGPVCSVRGDPLGMIARKKVLARQQQLYVHPEVVPVDMEAVGLLKDIEGITTSNLSSSDVSFHALRDYSPGDDRRSVHWKTTARMGRLMVRQFEETMRAHLLILWSTREQDYASNNDFELAVSTVGSLAASALLAERQVTIQTSVGELTFPNVLGLLDKLSGIERSQRGHDPRQAAIAFGRGPGISVAAFVTGNVAVPELRAAQLALPLSLRSFGVRCGENLEFARRRIGDLTVVDVDSLSKLRRALKDVL